MNNLYLKILIVLLIGLSTAIHAEKKSAGSIESNATSITSKDKQKVTEDFYKFRDWAVTSILPEINAQTLHKNIRNFNIDNINESINELEANLLTLSVIHLKSGDSVTGGCNYPIISTSVRSIMDSINELNSCNKTKCTEEKLNHIVGILKLEIEYQENFLPKCHELGVLSDQK